MSNLLWLVLAAAMEVGGDALVRYGIRNGRVIGFILGAIVLFLYGLSVNVPKWDFGRLMGIYIAMFFVVSQIVSVAVFRERLQASHVVGGILIVAGGAVMTFWQTTK